MRHRSVHLLSLWLLLVSPASAWFPNLFGRKQDAEQEENKRQQREAQHQQRRQEQLQQSSPMLVRQKSSSPVQAGSSPSGVSLPRSTSRGSAIGMRDSPSSQSSPLGVAYMSSNPIPMQQRPNGGTLHRTGSSQRFSLDRSYSDQEPIIVRSLNQGVTSSFSPRFLSEAVIELRDKKAFAVGYRKIEDILAQPYNFIDKSLFIKRVVEDPHKLLVFLRPRLTGKSVNASLLATFLDCRQEPSDGFKRLLKLMKESEYQGFVKGSGGKHLVVWMDWATSGVLEASDDVEIEMRMVHYMHQLLRDHLGPLGLLQADMHKCLPEGVDLDVLLASDSLDHLTSALGAIAAVLGRATESQLVFIIDDYDEVYRKAAEVGAYSVISHFLRRLFKDLARHGKSNIWKIIAFGTHRLKDDGPFSKCKLDNTGNGMYYSYLGSRDPYQEDFAFTEAEVAVAMSESSKPLSMTLGQLEEWYQIVSEGTRTTLFHPHSIAAALKYDQLDLYWTQEKPLGSLTKYPFNRMDGTFGPGDLFSIAIEPQSSEYTWPAEPLPIDYGSKTTLQTEHLLSWLHSEGFATRGQLSGLEAGEHVRRAAFYWFDNLTGFTQPMLIFKYPDVDLQNLALKGFQQAFESVLALPNFRSGQTVAQSGHAFMRFLNLLLASVYYMSGQWQYEGTSMPLLRVSPTDLVIFYFDLSGRPPYLSHLAARFHSSRMAHLVEDGMSSWLLCMYLDERQQPSVSFTKVSINL